MNGDFERQKLVVTDRKRQDDIFPHRSEENPNEKSFKKPCEYFHVSAISMPFRRGRRFKADGIFVPRKRH
jgi:hypothetical protein